MIETASPCLVCEGPGALADLQICPPCLEDLPWLDDSSAGGMACGQLRSVHSIFAYEFPLDRLIHRFKFRADPFLGARLAAVFSFAVGASSELSPLVRESTLVPIPLHPTRYLRRGFNQSAILASAIVGDQGDMIVADALARRRVTRSQAGLSARQRQRNLDCAFVARPHRCAGLSVLLIDDVVTTGATFDAAARACLAAGAVTVDGLSLARTL